MKLELVSEVFGVCSYFMLKRGYASWCPEYCLYVAKDCHEIVKQNMWAFGNYLDSCSNRSKMAVWF